MDYEASILFVRGKMTANCISLSGKVHFNVTEAMREEIDAKPTDTPHTWQLFNIGTSKCMNVGLEELIVDGAIEYSCPDMKLNYELIVRN